MCWKHWQELGHVGCLGDVGDEFLSSSPVCAPLQYAVVGRGRDGTFKLADAGNTCRDRTFVYRCAGNTGSNGIFCSVGHVGCVGDLGMIL